MMGEDRQPVVCMRCRSTGIKGVKPALGWGSEDASQMYLLDKTGHLLTLYRPGLPPLLLQHETEGCFSQRHCQPRVLGAHGLASVTF